MLGSGLGKKVDARFMNDQYHAFLTQRNRENNMLLKAKQPRQVVIVDKRAEAKKKGIFIEADNPENLPTEKEITAAISRPAIFKVEIRDLHWKHDLVKDQKSEAKTTDSKNPSNSSISVESSVLAISEDTNKSISPISLKCASTESNDNQDKQNSIPLLRNKRNKANDLLIKDIRDNGDDIFGHLDDVDLEKILTDFALENLGGVDKFDKLMLEAAGQILKVAHREKAIEKTLKKEENEILGKFFAGKIPYNREVLRVLDEVLDRIIDYLKNNNVQLDNKTKIIIEKRSKLKAAMLNAIFLTPQFLPMSWINIYDCGLL